MSSSADPAAIGLRERKKARTRAALREHGLRLFREQGYAATTIEQIAEAADVSPSTFFRYFPTKEDLVLVDDTDPLLLAALAEQPIEKNPIAAVRVAIETVLSNMSDEDLQREGERHELMVAVPELRAAAMDEFKRNVDMLTEVVATRLGRATDDFEVRVFAGAVIGAALSVFESPTADYRSTLKALEFLEAGLPLT